MPAEPWEVIIVGAGPVGLFLGCALEKRGFRCLILEKSLEPPPHSRSIGIHPPSLERLAQLGLAEMFLRQGIAVPEGVVWIDGRRLGSLSFKYCPGPYNFVLAIPQNLTEAILEERFRSQSGGELIRGAEVRRITLNSDSVEVEAILSGGASGRWTGKFVAGCDGKSSQARQAAGISFPGRPYEDAFLLGDFDDLTGFGSSAHIFLGRDGLVESFPLPATMRRWVVRAAASRLEASATLFCRVVKERAGQDLDPAACRRLNAFTVQKHLASRFFSGRLVLAGDAAHVMSPIGGQGMNIGWMEAWDLAEAFERILQGGQPFQKVFSAYDRRARRRARQAIWRAELNLSFARKHRWPSPHLLFLWLILQTPLQRFFARLFTMRWI